MGRELKRVPMDFDWPIGKVWNGYLNPYHAPNCKACEGSGMSPEMKKLSDDWCSFDKSEWIYTSPDRRYNNKAWQYHLTQVEVDALLEAGCLRDLISNGNKPTPEQVNQWATTGMGHDSINQWICVKARAKSLGMDIEKHCAYCQGEGDTSTPELRKLRDEWTKTDPPAGEGYQLWGTSSEGDPKSPVFSTLDALCEWCETNATTFSSFKASKEEWMKMLDDGFVSHTEGNMIFI